MTTEHMVNILHCGQDFKMIQPLNQQKKNNLKSVSKIF